MPENSSLMEERKGEGSHLQKQIRGLLFIQKKKKKQVTSCSACHLPQEEEISVVDFKANDMPGTFLPTVSTTTVHR